MNYEGDNMVGLAQKDNGHEGVHSFLREANK